MIDDLQPMSAARRTLVVTLVASVIAGGIGSLYGLAQADSRRMQHTIVAMGPDPGGKTGDGVTAQTTRTGHPALDHKTPDGASPTMPRPDDGRTNAPDAPGAPGKDANTGQRSSRTTSDRP